jgi:effector-binding domain-containing protein
LSSTLHAITKNRDSVIIEWNAVLQTGNNPFTKLSAVGLRKSIGTVFESLCNFAGKTENIYGFPIERTTFTEVNLMAYRFNTATYPTTDIVYDAINKLRQYIISQGAAEKYYPMISTKQADSSKYETMIAISVDKTIQPGGSFFSSQMVAMKDRFLATEVTGGPATLEQAHRAIQNYMRDHILSPPGRPFEILLTDRSKETDTTKWRTKIFYPSM